MKERLEKKIFISKRNFCFALHLKSKNKIHYNKLKQTIDEQLQ